MLTLLFVLTVHFETYAKTANQTALATPVEKQEIIPSGLISFSGEPMFSHHAFVVDKSKRTLTVYERKGDKIKFVSEHPADIGKNNGPKTKLNDQKTPVGIYFLQKELAQPEIPFEQYGNLAFTTDYPNIFDQRDYRTGYGIWLHAVPDTVPLTRGSRGCVVVRNDVIKLLKDYVKLGQTPILIYDKVEYKTEQEQKLEEQKFRQHVEDWRAAWETQDVDTYIKFYDPTFKNDQVNYSQWYRHKRKLKKLYSFIKVQLSEPVILRNKDQVVIRTTQRYKSNLHEDYGIKTIHARWSPAVGFKIIREDWSPLADPLAEGNANSEEIDPQAALLNLDKQDKN